MKKIIAILLTMIFVFAITSVTFAAEKAAAPAAEKKMDAKTDAKKDAAPAEKKDAKPAKKAAVKQATGEVTAVDAKANTITVKAAKGDVTVSADDKTKFMPKGKTIADVKAGDKVKVTYTEADGKMTAKSVTIMPEAKKKEAKKDAAKKEAAPAEKKAAAPVAAPAKKDAPAAPAAAAPAAPAAPAKKKSAGY